SIASDARPILAAKQNMRVVTADFAAMANRPTTVGEGEHATGTEMRSFLGGMLAQEPDSVTEARSPWPPPPGSNAASAGPRPGAAPETQIRVGSKTQPTPEEWTAPRFAGRPCRAGEAKTDLLTPRECRAAVRP